ncbi:hypothetical protein CRENBAI_005430 [Crenichthys baileyi]|uniref:Uncharacterized protein n=1 Tax=Crenichthys baileyi TaxID=28760 RepID=A0AAV9SMG3_9TELE
MEEEHETVVRQFYCYPPSSMSDLQSEAAAQPMSCLQSGAASQPTPCPQSEAAVQPTPCLQSAAAAPFTPGLQSTAAQPTPHLQSSATEPASTSSTLVLVVASESSDEGFEDEPLPDPVPEQFVVEPLSGRVPGLTTKGSASASEGSPGTVSASKGSPGAVSASEGSLGYPDSCSAAACRPGLHASAGLLVFAIVAVAGCPGSYVSADLLAFTFIATTGAQVAMCRSWPPPELCVCTGCSPGRPSELYART